MFVVCAVGRIVMVAITNLVYLLFAEINVLTASPTALVLCGLKKIASGNQPHLISKDYLIIPSVLTLTLTMPNYAKQI